VKPVAACQLSITAATFAASSRRYRTGTPSVFAEHTVAPPSRCRRSIKAMRASWPLRVVLRKLIGENRGDHGAPVFPKVELRVSFKASASRFRPAAFAARRRSRRPR